MPFSDLYVVWSTEYGLTEASTGISIGSQPPLLTPSTQAGEASPFYPVLNVINVPLARANGMSRSNSSSASSKRRLSWISSETASSADSSSSSGVCDTNIHTTDEDWTRGRCTTSLEDNKHLGRQGSKSVTESSTSQTENNPKQLDKPLDRIPSGGESASQETWKSADEDKRGGFFFRTFSFRERSSSDRQRTKSSEEALDGAFARRSLREKDFNTLPRRRSLIGRISNKSLSEERTRRRSVQMTRPVIEELPPQHRTSFEESDITGSQTQKHDTLVRS